MSYCEQCGSEYKGGEKFCGVCGSRFLDTHSSGGTRKISKVRIAIAAIIILLFAGILVYFASNNITRKIGPPTKTVEFKLVCNDSGMLNEAIRGSLPEGYELRYLHSSPLLLKSQTWLSNDDIASIEITENRGSLGCSLAIELNFEGKNKLAKITQQNIGRQLAILIDGAVFSAPVIRESIPSGKLSISTNFLSKNKAKGFLDDLYAHKTGGISKMQDNIPVVSLSSDDGLFFSLNKRGDILSKSLSPEHSLPIVRGTALAERMKIMVAIKVIDGVERSNLKRYCTIHEINVLNLENIVLDIILITGEQLEIRLGGSDIEGKYKVLEVVLRELNHRGEPINLIKFIDLRFSNPVIGFKNNKK